MILLVESDVLRKSPDKIASGPSSLYIFWGQPPGSRIRQTPSTRPDLPKEPSSGFHNSMTRVLELVPQRELRDARIGGADYLAEGSAA